MAMNCENCCWFKDNAPHEVGGVCYLNPPTVFYSEDIDGYIEVRPRVLETDICSHFTSEKPFKKPRRV